jgi:hypothetical protein
VKLDATKLILALVMLLQGAIIWIGTDIKSRINRVEFKITMMAVSGQLDPVADYIADQDSLTEAQRMALNYILEKSE